MAQAAEPLKVVYGLYAGGFNVVDINGTYTLNDDAYILEMDLKTEGMLGKLAPWAGILKTDGHYKNGQPTPLEHVFANTWRDETKTSVMTFGKSGDLKSYTVEEDGKMEDKMPAADIYADNPVDVLTGLLRAMDQPSCAGTQPIIDGKRRFDMVLKSKGQETIEQSRYTAFNGEVEICDIEIVPVAGKWRDKPRGWMSIQEQAKNQGQLPRLWFGKVRDDLPPIPVRFQIITDYGTMLMHVKEIKG